MIADRRICKTADGEPCEVDDPRAAWLVVGGAGQTIPPGLVQELGLRLENGRVAWGAPPPAGDDDEADSEDRSVATTNTLPDGYQLEHLGGGYFTLLTPDGTLEEEGEPVRIRGKSAAIEHFAERIRATEE